MTKEQRGYVAEHLRNLDGDDRKSPGLVDEHRAHYARIARRSGEGAGGGRWAGARAQSRPEVVVNDIEDAARCRKSFEASAAEIARAEAEVDRVRGTDAQRPAQARVYELQAKLARAKGVA